MDICRLADQAANIYLVRDFNSFEQQIKFMAKQAFPNAKVLFKKIRNANPKDVDITGLAFIKGDTPIIMVIYKVDNFYKPEYVGGDIDKLKLFEKLSILLIFTLAYETFYGKPKLKERVKTMFKDLVKAGGTVGAISGLLGVLMTLTSTSSEIEPKDVGFGFFSSLAIFSMIYAAILYVTLNDRYITILKKLGCKELPSKIDEAQKMMKKLRVFYQAKYKMIQKLRNNSNNNYEPMTPFQ